MRSVQYMSCAVRFTYQLIMSRAEAHTPKTSSANMIIYMRYFKLLVYAESSSLLPAVVREFQLPIVFSPTECITVCPIRRIILVSGTHILSI